MVSFFVSCIFPLSRKQFREKIFVKNVSQHFVQRKVYSSKIKNVKYIYEMFTYLCLIVLLKGILKQSSNSDKDTRDRCFFSALTCFIHLYIISIFHATYDTRSCTFNFRITNLLRLILIFIVKLSLNLSLNTLRIISLAAEHLKINLKKP